MNGKRTQPKNRLEDGQSVRIPPLRLDQPKPRAAGSEADEKTRAFLKSITLYEDADVLVFNKPMGLAVQAGSGTTRHLDGMLEVLRDAHGQRPRLVHRLDKDTAGCLLVAKTRFAATALEDLPLALGAESLLGVVAGVPKVQQGRISTFLAKEEREDESFMRIAQHGDKGASHAVTYYAVWRRQGRCSPGFRLSRSPAAPISCARNGAHRSSDRRRSEIFFPENWELPGGMQNKLHLLARRIVVPHPRGGMIDVTAPLPPHMQHPELSASTPPATTRSWRRRRSRPFVTLARLREAAAFEPARCWGKCPKTRTRSHLYERREALSRKRARANDEPAG